MYLGQDFCISLGMQNIGLSNIIVSVSGVKRFQSMVANASKKNKVIIFTL